MGCERRADRRLSELRESELVKGGPGRAFDAAPQPDAQRGQRSPPQEVARRCRGFRPDFDGDPDPRGRAEHWRGPTVSREVSMTSGTPTSRSSAAEVLDLM